jgi:hypothetical protein
LRPGGSSLIDRKLKPGRSARSPHRQARPIKRIVPPTTDPRIGRPDLAAAAAAEEAAAATAAEVAEVTTTVRAAAAEETMPRTIGMKRLRSETTAIIAIGSVTEVDQVPAAAKETKTKVDARRTIAPVETGLDLGPDRGISVAMRLTTTKTTTIPSRRIKRKTTCPTAFAAFAAKPMARSPAS